MKESVKEMKESKLIMMQKDVKIIQQALAVALYKIEQLEKENDNGGENTKDTRVQDLVDKKKG
tara:strand:+ start:63 stop:251 length:189 start_codon:yes stop_codon:yes gene_type:complete